MLRTRRILTVLLALAALGSTAVQAQAPAPRGAPGNDILTLNAYGGGFSPTADLTTGGGFRRSGTVGGAVALWLHRNVGVRGNLLFARTEAGIGAPEAIEGERPNVWAYSGDLVLRLPLAAAGRTSSWVPYLVGGLGGKSYDFESLSTESDFAGNYGGGLEYRLAGWGVQAEVRDIVTNFERFGASKTQHDLVWTAGITRSF